MKDLEVSFPALVFSGQQRSDGEAGSFIIRCVVVSYVRPDVRRELLAIKTVVSSIKMAVCQVNVCFVR